MGISEQEKNILHNLFNKVGLEGSSTDEIKYYIKNIYLYKEPEQKIIQSIDTKEELEKQDTKSSIKTYIMPQKLSFKTNIGNNKNISIVSAIGQNNNDKNNDNGNDIHNKHQKKQTTHTTFKDKLSFNTTISKEKVHGIFIRIGEPNK